MDGVWVQICSYDLSGLRLGSCKTTKGHFTASCCYIDLGLTAFGWLRFVLMLVAASFSDCGIYFFNEGNVVCSFSNSNCTHDV